jgi:hypothetical protein
MAKSTMAAPPMAIPAIAPDERTALLVIEGEGEEFAGGEPVLVGMDATVGPGDVLLGAALVCGAPPVLFPPGSRFTYALQSALGAARGHSGA